jgi:16S rRNA (uracil1498-N3)-methyltransferase
VTKKDAISEQARRFFVPLPPSVTGQLPNEFQVTDADILHHLVTVCRVKQGEKLVLTDPIHEKAYVATVQSSSRNELHLNLEACLPTAADQLPHVILIAALIKEQRWDPLLQRCTELGVRSIWPVSSERSIVRLERKDIEKKKGRWNDILQMAAEQSEGLFVPKLENVFLGVAEIESVLKQYPDALKILLMERGEDRTVLKQILREHGSDSQKENHPIMMAIGPEGGWSDAEAKQFVHMGFHFASLGDRILRSDTAAMAAMAAVVYESWDA